MQRKIDIGVDKNLFVVDPKADSRPTMSFLMDDLPKTPEDALQEARKLAWINWINSEPLIQGHVDENGKAFLFFISEAVKNKVVVLDVWDYTLLPCRRSLDYVNEWNRRYSGAGLVIIGVHSPMFDFGRDKKNIIDAVKDLGIAYPVVLDNNFDIWRSLENRYWPRRILIDAQTRINMDMTGEGGYAEFEKAIQVQLRELSPGLACPPVLRPLRRTDDEDYEIPQTTSEVFFGMKRNPRLGNVQIPTAAGAEVVYKDESPGSRAAGLPYFDGTWIATHESMYCAASSKGDLHVSINFNGTDAYMVARSRPKNPVDVPQTTKVQTLIDGKPVADDSLTGDTLFNEYRRSITTVRDPKLYHLARKLEDKAHELTVIIDNKTADTLELFGLFFEHNA